MKEWVVDTVKVPVLSEHRHPYECTVVCLTALIELFSAVQKHKQGQ